MRLFLLISFFLLSIVQIAFTQDTELKPRVNVNGFAEMDVIYDFNRLDPDWNSALRASKIPVNPEDPGWGTNGEVILSVKYSRLSVQGIIPTNHKWGDIKTIFEFDLFGVAANAGETAFHLRLAYGEMGPLLAGQDWTTFMDLSVFPNYFEYWGPSGQILIRNPMVRYTFDLGDDSKLAFAIEHPGSQVDPGQIREVDPSLNVTSIHNVPDLIARYRIEKLWGHFQAAGLIRSLGYDAIGDSIDLIHGNEFGWGLNLSSVVNLYQRDKLRLQFVFGEGYAGYNDDGGVELAPDENSNAVTPFQYGIVVFYDIFWNKHWTNSIGYSETTQDNSAGQLDNALYKLQYAIFNTTYHIVTGKAMVALEYQFGKRYNKNKATANDNRIMFTAKFLFGKPSLF